MVLESDILLAGFYHFAPLEDYEERKPELFALCESLGVKGSILLAPEGINASIGGERGAIKKVLDHIHAWKGFEEFTVRYDAMDEAPFKRMKVRLKQEIVMLRSHHQPKKDEGIFHVKADQWEALMERADVPVIDTRNDFEVAVGTFKGALDPKTKKFSEFTEWAKEHVDPQATPEVAMFCTGGIRCEKAATVLHELGVEKVYQLEGGILQYFRDVGKERADGYWDGNCFVFDERVAVNTAMEETLPDTPECYHTRIGLDKKREGFEG